MKLEFKSSKRAPNFRKSYDELKAKYGDAFTLIEWDENRSYIKCIHSRYDAGRGAALLFLAIILAIRRWRKDLSSNLRRFNF
jgi:hypothetical protein